MNPLRRILATVCILSAAAGAASAQQTFTDQELDIETAVELALANNLGIRSQRIETLIAERDYAH
ncbi:MAG: hypothetical protein ACOC0D_08405, partial [Spirochaeta sp.]